MNRPGTPLKPFARLHFTVKRRHRRAVLRLQVINTYSCGSRMADESPWRRGRSTFLTAVLSERCTQAPSNLEVSCVTCLTFPTPCRHTRPFTRTSLTCPRLLRRNGNYWLSWWYWLITAQDAPLTLSEEVHVGTTLVQFVDDLRLCFLHWYCLHKKTSHRLPS